MAERSHFDKIEAYLTGQMPVEEARAFEREAADDPTLANQLKLQRLEHDAMERMLEQELKDKMARWAGSPPANPFAEEEAGRLVPMSGKKNAQWFRIAAAVSGVLLIAVLLWQITQDPPAEVVDKPAVPEQPGETPIEKTPPVTTPEEEQIADTPDEPVQQPPAPVTPPPRKNAWLALATRTYEPPPPFSSRLKSGDAAAEKSVLLQAAEAFDSGEYNVTLDLLGPPDNDDQSTVRYLRGHAYFNLGQYANAAGEFRVVAMDEFLPNYQEAQWYLLLSYLAQMPGKEKEFRALAGRLAADEYSDYREEAKQLLEKVGN